MKLITTSWDDGNVLDFKLAGLLAKYNLPATFYIPQSNAERSVMKETEIKTLAKDFEIGGHTITHAKLNTNNEAFLKKEITGSYHWLGDLLGDAPLCFCFPGGVYNQKSLEQVFASGYELARSTELLSTKAVNSDGITPTTLQAYPHSKFTYTKHLLKRKRGITLFSWLKNKSETQLSKLTEYYLKEIVTKSGCFHIWGHSWEIEQHNLWNRLEIIFNRISSQPQFSYVSNCGLVQYKQSSL